MVRRKGRARPESARRSATVPGAGSVNTAFVGSGRLARGRSSVSVQNLQKVTWIALELRSGRLLGESERAKAREALEYFEREFWRNHKNDGRGRRKSSAVTRVLVSIANRLIKERASNIGEAVRAAVGTGTSKDIARVERALRLYRQGKSGWVVLTHHEADYAAAVKRLPNIHRIK